MLQSVKKKLVSCPVSRRTRPAPCAPSSATRADLAPASAAPPRRAIRLLTAATLVWQGGGSQTDSKATGAGVKPAASAARPGAAAAPPAKGAAPGAKPPGAGDLRTGMAPGSAGGKAGGKKNGPLEALPAFKGALRPLDPSAVLVCTHETRA